MALKLLNKVIQHPKQLHNSTKEDKSIPPSLFSVSLASAGDSFTCATKESSDSRMSESYCWGKNNFLQLGSKDAGSSQSIPFQVNALQSKIMSLSLGGVFGCALIAGNGLKCWGRNDAFQLGNALIQNQTPTTFVTNPERESSRIYSWDESNFLFLCFCLYFIYLSRGDSWLDGLQVTKPFSILDII